MLSMILCYQSLLCIVIVVIITVIHLLLLCYHYITIHYLTVYLFAEVYQLPFIAALNSLLPCCCYTCHPSCPRVQCACMLCVLYIVLTTSPDDNDVIGKKKPANIMEVSFELCLRSADNLHRSKKW
jgi:hypothetical protein